MSNKSQLQVRGSEATEHGRVARPFGPVVVTAEGRKDADPLDSFKPESSPWPSIGRNKSSIIVVAMAILVAAAAGATALYLRDGRAAATSSIPSRSGHVVLHSRPAGAIVSVDGLRRGVTPVELDLPSGSHDVLFVEGTAERRVTLSVEAGMRISEDVDLPNAQARAAGQLEITSDPPGAAVTIDGNSAGVTPLTVQNISPARHMIAVSQGETVVNRAVEVSAGASASVFVALGARGRDATGWLALDAPVELRILENGQVIGLSGGAPVMLPKGRHQVELVNDSVEMHLTRTLMIDAGKSTRVTVPLPNGTLYVNAAPWADILVDGRSIGTTPLGAVPLPVGNHELIAKHPQLGEKRRAIVVGAQTPVRVSMDLNR
ncbi:MAG: amylopullulanase [Acidobacteria bacterium]|nr:amylopullulanase [Acidobacteriota bacterium]